MSNSRILIVDDEPKVAFFFQKNLEWGGHGYIVDAVNSGEEALSELRNNPYDLLITDFRMPKMNGLELLKQVRQISPATKTILVTAYGTDDLWQEADQLDIFRSLSKPLKINDLLAAVREALTQPTKQEPTKQFGSELVVLTDEHFDVLSSRIENLRVDVGAHAVILADTDGHVLTYTGDVEELELSVMMALLGGLIAAAGELSRQFKYDESVHLSYFEGPPYDLYAANVSYNIFITIVYDRRQEKSAVSRIGLVWLYTCRALAELQELLGQQTKATTQSPFSDGFAQSLQGELDNLFEDELLPATTLLPTTNKLTQTQVTVSNEAYNKVNWMLSRFGKQTKLIIEPNLSALKVDMPTAVMQLLVKILSAGLKNIYQHSHATTVRVTFLLDGSCLKGYLSDDGVGFIEDIPPNLKTLATLKQETIKRGGRLFLQGQLNRGATLVFILPISNEGNPCNVH